MDWLHFKRVTRHYFYRASHRPDPTRALKLGPLLSLLMEKKNWVVFVWTRKSSKKKKMSKIGRFQFWLEKLFGVDRLSLCERRDTSKKDVWSGGGSYNNSSSNKCNSSSYINNSNGNKSYSSYSSINWLMLSKDGGMDLATFNFCFCWINLPNNNNLRHPKSKIIILIWKQFFSVGINWSCWWDAWVPSRIRSLLD